MIRPLKPGRRSMLEAWAREDAHACCAR